MRERDRWILLPENRAARVAIQRVRACLSRRGPRRTINPLFLHGPAGSGKTHLVDGLVQTIMLQMPDAIVSVLLAGDLDGRDTEQDERAWKQADLVVVEDVHKLPIAAIETLVTLVDGCMRRQRQLVLTATAGPGQLPLPVRLTSRLAQGLVVALEALSLDSRREVLRQRSSSLADEVRDWLARHTDGSFRQLEGALVRIAGLSAALGRAPALDEVCAVFREDAEARRLTIERIAQSVSRYFQVETRELRSRGRSRQTLVPRQVSMYLARRLTTLSLEQIGDYFGGRDHSTVLHACKKVEEAISSDASLSGAVRELHAGLT
jgi:chromosomal replication initiator protein